jgi:hypothetical protein
MARRDPRPVIDCPMRALAIRVTFALVMSLAIYGLH